MGKHIPKRPSAPVLCWGFRDEGAATFGTAGPPRPGRARSPSAEARGPGLSSTGPSAHRLGLEAAPPPGLARALRAPTLLHAARDLFRTQAPAPPLTQPRNLAAHICLPKHYFFLRERMGRNKKKKEIRTQAASET